MKRASVLLVLLAGLAPGAYATGLASAGEAVPEDLTRWEFYTEISPAGVQGGQLCDLIVPPWVFGRARPGLGDLRLCDRDDKTIPYALRVRSERINLETIPARTFNRTYNGETGTAELSLDLGAEPREHTTVVLNLGGDDFRRPVRLEGSADGMKWSVLLDKVQAIHISAGGQVLDVRRFNYPPSRFRYLRVQVAHDPGKPEDRPRIDSVDVLHSVQVPGELATLDAGIGQRQAVPTPGGPGSAWYLDLGYLVPVDRVHLRAQPGDGTFVRPYVVKLANPGEPVRQLASGDWRRHRVDDQAPLEVRFGEVMASRLLLEVTDSRNPPLTLTQATCAAPARQVVFRMPKALAAPLRLYYGNPQAEAPNYDFAATLPVVLDPAPQRLQAGSQVANPKYTPLPRPWTERYPWLVDAVLGVAGGVLLVILIVLGRQALRRYDARVGATAG